MTDLLNAELAEADLGAVTGGVSQTGSGTVLKGKIDTETKFGREYYYYHVVNGDQLSTIAQHFKTTTADLMKMNPQITNANALYVGQRIRVPGEK